MNTSDKTLLTSNEHELEKIYEEETLRLQQNEIKLNFLQRLTIEDFPRDLSESSRKNIEKALLAVKIRDYINLGSDQKLLGLNEFDISKIDLSYTEKKMIRERVEHLISLEKIKNEPSTENAKELLKEQKRLIELQKENITKTETLSSLKLQELELLKECANVLVSSSQKDQVQGILDDAKIVNLKIANLIQVCQDSENERTSQARKAFGEISRYVDDLLKGKKATES